MNEHRNKTVLVTGASSGIGEAFAHEFARRGAHLVLAARSERKLHRIAEELTKNHGVRVTVVPVDLATRSGTQELYQRTVDEKITVDLLVNNAGFATHGFFDRQPLDRQYDEVLLNVGTVVEMTHRFIQGMVARGTGTIINVASTAAFFPVPYMATYAATKAFVLSFSEALWEENRKRGIRVLALCPGATETGFFQVVGTEKAGVGKRATPQAVAQAALRALARKRSFVVQGGANRVFTILPRFFSRRMTVRITGGSVRPD